jgi:hypothetical protein
VVSLYVNTELISFILYIPSIEKVKELNPMATFKEWWKEGQLSDFTIKKIVKHKAPEIWQHQLKLNTIGPDQMSRLATGDIIRYYETLETLEQKKRTPYVCHLYVPFRSRILSMCPTKRAKGKSGNLEVHIKPAYTHTKTLPHLGHVILLDTKHSESDRTSQKLFGSSVLACARKTV